jgi:hypothetical protein
MRALVVMVMASTLAALGGATAASSSTSPPSCSTSHLHIFLGGGSGGAAGSVYTGLNFTNTGTTTCTLRGFPGVSFIDGSHHQLGASAQRTTPPSSHTITLHPGAHASSILRITQTANYPRSTCKPVAARGLRIYPPGATRSAFVTYRHPVCWATSIHQLSVTATRAGPAAD